VTLTREDLEDLARSFRERRCRALREAASLREDDGKWEGEGLPPVTGSVD
jgi:hypothetical protein